MAHVFIVDEKTFDIHLKYNFAGTGAKNSDGTYLIDNCIEIQSSTEITITKLLADISRIRKGDKILFYLQQKSRREGMFFGTFEATERAFLCKDRYLEQELGKKLIFRIAIKPEKVFPIGVTERECLDSFEGITHPYEVCWSLIYRKLKGNRGCTMITDAEYEYILRKIQSKNVKSIEKIIGLKFDSNNSQIITSNNNYSYEGCKESLNIFNRLKYKFNKKNAYETHLQAYIMQNLELIEELQVINKNINWIGNEMYCGVGMQSIDTIFIQEDDKTHIVICELKDEQPEEYIKNQLFKYIDWSIQFIAPTIKNKVIIHPTIVAPHPKEKTLLKLQKIDIKNFNDIKKIKIEHTRYISFKIEEEKIVFTKENIE